MQTDIIAGERRTKSAPIAAAIYAISTAKSARFAVKSFALCA